MGCWSREPLAKGSVLGGDSFADLRTGGQALPAGCQRGLAAKGQLATPYVTSVRGAKTSTVWRLGLAVTGECRSRRSCSNFQCQSPRTPARPSTLLCKLQPPLPSPANQTSVQIAPRSRSALAARSDGPYSHGAASAPVKRLVPASPRLCSSLPPPPHLPPPPPPPLTPRRACLPQLQRTLVPRPVSAPPIGTIPCTSPDTLLQTH